MDKTAIRHAATVILVRDPSSAPRILMGQRGAKAAFMPSKFVFPGGAMDPGDLQVPFGRSVPEPCAGRVAQGAGPELMHGLFAAAIRELWEETGLALGIPGDWPGGAPEDWASFTQAGLLPDPSALQYVFRAITPPGRPRRFDARFLLADAGAVQGDPDDFSGASDELSHLQWVPIEKVRDYALPFITEVVLAEVAASLPELARPASVPFFDNSGDESVFRRIVD